MVLARKDPLAVQAKLCRRMERSRNVSDPAVPSDNNAAERSLRHLVTSQDQRRHPLRAGHRQQDDLGGTWRARGLNPLLECRRLLTSPQL